MAEGQPADPVILLLGKSSPHLEIHIHWPDLLRDFKRQKEERAVLHEVPEHRILRVVYLNLRVGADVQVQFVILKKADLYAELGGARTGLQWAVVGAVVYVRHLVLQLNAVAPALVQVENGSFVVVIGGLGVTDVTKIDFPVVAARRARIVGQQRGT